MTDSKCTCCGGTLVQGEVYNGGAGRRLCRRCGHDEGAPLLKSAKLNPAKFRQISATTDGVLALDERGGVWKLSFAPGAPSVWMQTPKERRTR